MRSAAKRFDLALISKHEIMMLDTGPNCSPASLVRHLKPRAHQVRDRVTVIADNDAVAMLQDVKRNRLSITKRERSVYLQRNPALGAWHWPTFKSEIIY